MIKYIGTFAGSGGFNAIRLGALPLRMVATLNNNTANHSIDLVVSAVNEPLKWAANSGTWDIGTSVNWKDAAANSTTYQEQLGLGDQVVLEDNVSGLSPITITNNSIVTPAGFTVTNSSKSYTITGNGSIAGAVALNKQGSGTLTVTTTNTFTGAVNLNGGVLNFTNSNNLGNGTAINFGGGTLQYATGNTADISVRTVTLNAGGGTIDTAGNNVSFANRIGNSGIGGLTKTGAGSLTLNTNSTYSGNTVVNQGTLALGAGISLSNSAAVVVNSSATLDASATGFGFNLNGAISQVLAGSGTVTGIVTSVTGAIITPGTNGTVGTLTFGNDLDLNGGTYVFDVATTSHDLLVVEGALNIQNPNGGTLTINPVNTLTNGVYKLIQYAGSYNGGLGGITVSGGQANKIFTLSDATGGEIDLVVTGSSTNNLTWTGDGGNNNYWDIDGAGNWFDNYFMTNGAFFDNGDIVTFDDSYFNSGSESPAVNIENGPVAPAAVAVNTTNTYTFDGAKITGGSATLTKNGTGTLVLATVGNDYGGLTTVNNGVLQIGDGSTSGTSIGIGNVTDNGSLIFYQPDNSTVLGNIGGTGTLYQQGANSTATVTLLGNNNYSGVTTVDTGILQIGNGGLSGTLGGNAVTMLNAGTLIIDRAGTFSLGNGISGNGALSLAGPGTVTLSGANSYLNNTTITNGILKLGADNAIPSGGSTTGWLVLDGSAATAGILDLNGHNQAVNELTGLGGTVLGQIVNNGGSGLNTLTIGTTLASTTYAGLIENNINSGTGQVGLDIVGDGSLTYALTLSGANSYSGPVYIDGAKVILASAASQLAIGTGPVTLTNNGTLQMAYYGSGANTQGSFVNSVLVPAGATGNLLTLGRGTYSGNITVHGTLNLTTSYVRSEPTGDWSASDGQINIIAGTAGGNVYWANAGNWSLGTAAVDLGSGVYFQNSANTGTGGNTITIGELTGSGTITDTSPTGGTNRITTYIIGGRNSNATFAGTIANLNRQVAINKVGIGSWTLTGTDTATAQTTVTSGSLIIGTASSFMSNCTNITVAAGALFDVSVYNGLTLSAGQTFAGSGVITGAVEMVDSDILTPGSSTVAGTLSFSNNLTLGSGSGGYAVTNNFALSSDPTGISKTNSQVIVAGDLTLTGTNIVVINPLNNILGAGTYTLFKYSGNLHNENGLVPDGALLTNNLVAGGAFAANSDVSLVFSNDPGAVVMIVIPNGQDLTWQGGVTGTVTNNWDVNISSNWLNVAESAVTNFLQYDNVIFNDSATNLNAIVAGTVAPGAITVNSTNAYTFSGTGKITGSTGITKSGTNVLTISNSGGNDYTGGVAVNNGTLQLGVSTALGATNSTTTVASGATLDIHGIQPVAQQIVVQGSGVGGNGAIINNGAQLVNQGFVGNITLSGDTTLGGSNRWDIFNGSLTGNNHNLSKVGSNYIVLTGLGNIGVSNIDVQTGYFTLIGNTTLGGNTSTLRLWNGARIDLYATTVTNTKPVSMTNAIISSSSGTNFYGGPITLNQTETFTATTPLVLNGPLGGSGGLLANGAGTLTVNNTETYTGNTTISNGALVLIGAASLVSSNLDVAVAGAVLDVSAKPSGLLTLASGQTLKGIGTVRGSVTVAANAAVSPGESGIGTLTVTNVVTLQGNTVMDVNWTNATTSDQITANTINVGGTLTLNNLGPALAAGNYFKLFNGTVSGGFANIVPATPGYGLAWNTNNLTTLNIISISSAPTVNTNAFAITNIVSGNSLNLSWPADHQGWEILIQTNTLATGLGTNWVPVASSTNGTTFSVPLDPKNGSVFIKMVYPPQ